MDKPFFADKVRGAWFGKCLAGAIGMPFEGVPFSLELKEENLSLANVPNDDLELQLVWLEALEKHGLTLNCRDMGNIWRKRIFHGCDEYSIAIYNLAHGIDAPASGYVNNYFADGMGATIRSEIWALVFAGRPDAAAHFASLDAQVDHWGDGVWCEVFMAASEAAVCVNSDIEKSLRSALTMVDKHSRTYRTLSKIFEMYDAGMDDESARCRIMLELQPHPNFTDCVMNTAFIVNALLRGKGDFMKTILDVVNFGRDTDCTAASAGAFLGAAKGMKVFPEKYLHAVTDEMVLSDFVSSIPDVPLTITALTEKTVQLHERLAGELPETPYPAYIPYAPQADLPELYTAKWLILNDEEVDINAVKEEISAHGGCPENLRDHVRIFHSPYLNLSEYAGCKRVHLLSILTVNNDSCDPDDLVFMATADVGLRVHLDERRILNNHSRHKMLPAFHRVQGGAAFSLPLKYGEKHLLHVELFHPANPVNACVMFGNTANDILDGYDLNI